MLWVWLSKCRYSVLVSADLQWHWYYPPRSVSNEWEGTWLVFLEIFSSIWNVAPSADPSREEGYSQFSYWADFSSDVWRGMSTLIKYSDQQQLAKNSTLKTLPNTLTFALSHFCNCLFITPQVDVNIIYSQVEKIVVSWWPELLFNKLSYFTNLKKT